MNNIKNTQKYIIQPSKEINNFILAEVNFEKLPFFAPSKRKTFKEKELTYKYQKEIVQNGKIIQLKWEVSAHPKFGGFLNQFDRDVYRCIQKLITTRGLINDGCIGFSIYEIAELLSRDSSGKTYQQIKNSIYKMVNASIQSQGTFYYKGEKAWIKDTFHLFERFTEKGRHLPEGGIAETNYLKISDWLLKSIKSGYLKPVDFDYYFSLKSSITKSLYSKLSVDFYGLPDDVKCLKKRYSNLCAETLITPQKYPSYAKRKLKKAFDELISTNFLSKVEFELIPNTKHDFYIKFYPGKRAKEPNNFKKIYPSPVEVFEPQQDKKLLTTNKNNTPVCHCKELKATKQIINIIDSVKDELSEEDLFILNSLLDIKVTEKAALECLEDHKEKTTYWLKAKDIDSRYQKASNKAGFILVAIKRNWSSPYYEKILTEKKQQKSFESQAQLKEIEKRRQELLVLEERLKFDEFYNSLTIAERNEIESKILDRLKKENAFLYNQYRKKGLTIGIEETLKSYRSDILKLFFKSK